MGGHVHRLTVLTGCSEKAFPSLLFWKKCQLLLLVFEVLGEQTGKSPSCVFCKAISSKTSKKKNLILLLRAQALLQPNISFLAKKKFQQEVQYI